MKCPIDTRRELLSNVVLAGGSTCFQGNQTIAQLNPIGFETRLQKELEKLTPSSMRTTDVNVIAPLNRKYLAWFGCSLYASLQSFPESCLWKYEYEEGVTDMDKFL